MNDTGLNESKPKDLPTVWREAVESQKGATVIRDLQYACPDGFPLHLDLCLPAENGGTFPVVVWICWGGWCECDKRWAPFSSLLVANGFATAAIRYRTSHEALAPASIQDCKAAVRWLRANAAHYNLDPDRIGAWGSSAGGHLAALLGVSAGVPELEGNGGHAEYSSAVKAVCDFNGPSDLTRVAIPEIREKYQDLYKVTECYLGGPVAERCDLARMVSPLTYVTRGSPPMLIFHGSADTVVPVEESELLYKAMRCAGAKAELDVLPGAEHGWDHVTLTDEKVISFFKRELD